MKEETLEKGIKLKSRIDEISKNLKYLRRPETTFHFWRDIRKLFADVSDTTSGFLFSVEWDSEENDFLKIQLINWYEIKLKELQSKLKAL